MATDIDVVSVGVLPWRIVTVRIDDCRDGGRRNDCFWPTYAGNATVLSAAIRPVTMTGAADNRNGVFRG